MKQVCLDPGHGVETAGKRSPDGSYREYEFALDMAQRVKAILERHGVAVTLTRETENDVTLANRVKTANAIQDLDLFVSLHSNAAGSGADWMSARGLEVYVYAKDDRSTSAGQAILARQAEAGVTVRNGGKPKDGSTLYVVRMTNAPACLVEHLFHDNKDDVALLKDDAYRQRMAEADAKGILDYLNITYKEDEDMSQSVCTATIPKGIVKAIRIVAGNGKSAQTLREELGCDYVLNGGIYDATGALCHVKSDGTVWAGDQWSYIGYGWDSGGDIRDVTIPSDEAAKLAHYIACVKVLGSGLVNGKPLYPDEMGGKRGRSCIALAGDDLILYCARDGSAYATTPEDLGQEMARRGATSALMLDGGGSSQCDFGAGGAVASSRDVRVHHYICIWTTQDIPGRYRVATQSSALNIRATPVTGTKVGSYPKGAEVDVLAVQDGWGRTVLGWCSMAYLDKIERADTQTAAEPPVAEPPVTPDQAADWAQAAWQKAYAAGVMDGTRPTESITRQEVAVILDRLGWLGGDV